MVRRRQSLNTTARHPIDDEPQHDEPQWRPGGSPAQTDTHYHPLTPRGASTALAAATAEHSANLAPSPFANGGTGRGAVGLGGAKKGKASQRSDSVALSQAEGGTFHAPLLDTHHAHSPRFATSFPPARISMASIMRNWTNKRSLLVIFLSLIFFTLILSPSKQRKEVFTKAGHALEQSWDKAEDYWSDVRKLKGAEIPLPPPPPPPPMRPSPPSTDPFPGQQAQDVEPHSISLPPMHAGSTVKEASILEAVRKKPTLHADKERTTRCTSNGGVVVDWKGQKRPVVQYAIMIDAGSTGSRVHVYKVSRRARLGELRSLT